MTKKLSVIMPAYDEESTIVDCVNRVLSKKIDGVEIELIIVESNSSDNTKNLINDLPHNDKLIIIYEDTPQGKGHAVRAGLNRSTGDFILIQDADNEYDINDYDALIKPLIEGKVDFVLGSRCKKGEWAIRKLENQPFKTFYLNIGHWFFTMLVNALYGLWLKDPATMYKVFRRDCLNNIALECNGFNFDWELLLKLVRSGYRPIELPVSYKSRSFHEGKKIKLFSDPLSWLYTIVKYRIVKI